MVTVKSFSNRQSKDGRHFITLELVGGLELVQSAQNGNFYATVRRCHLPATFDAETAAELVGTKMPGNIVKIESEPYEYTVPRTAEVITLQHTYAYQPSVNSIPVGNTPVSEVV